MHPRRRPRLALAAVAAAVAAVLAMALWPVLLHRHAHAGDATLARIRQRGYLIVGVPLWMPPFGAPSRAGAWQGLDVTLARGVAQALLGSPLQVHLLPLAPGERRWAVQSGAADLVAAAFAAPEGRGDPVPEAGAGVRPVGPYYTEPLALLVPRQAPIRRWRDLDGRVVAVLPGGPGGAALTRATAGRATPVWTETDSAAVAAREVALGHYRALVAGLAVARALAAYDPELAVQTPPGLGRVSYFALVPDDVPALGDAVRQAIAALPAGAALQRLLTVWAAGAASPRSPTPPVLTAPPPAA